ncbi:MAG: peptidylprolyl isomerase [Halothiobacillaceae bacterium]|jgi:FKBP-type peptidyl-prolyl cis-trans isomerase SlyD|nr:peptidylprolyl isomerase [Halothiobacillaceae bacterium]MDY0050861.1 peptidylprolyl isomerase [Halothiobacillaceae bacterium]
MRVSPNMVVTIDYTLTNDAGEVIDSSAGQGPLAYLHGHDNIIPGLEKGLEGREAGEQFKISIPPTDAYGERDPKLVQTVPSNLFEGVDAIEPGMRFQAHTDAGLEVVTVVAVNGDQITLDANHALAGETLHFEITVLEMRDATPDEIAHGHAHGPDGHHHDH